MAAHVPFHHARLCACLLGPLLPLDLAAAQTYTWSGGPTDVLWNDAQNWNPQGIPGVNPAGVDVVIGAGTPNIASPFQTLTLGSLMASRRVDVNGLIVLGGPSSMTDAVFGQAHNFTINSSLVLTGPQSSWVGGLIDGSGQLVIDQLTTVVSAQTDAVLEVDALVTGHLALGRRIILDGATMVNTGTITGQSIQRVPGQTPANGLLVNAGNMLVTGGQWSTNVINSGTFTVVTGAASFSPLATKDFTGGTVLVQSGQLAIPDATSLDTTLAGSMSGAGLLILNGTTANGFDVGSSGWETGMAGQQNVGLNITGSNVNLALHGAWTNTGAASLTGIYRDPGAPDGIFNQGTMRLANVTFECEVFNSGTIAIDATSRVRPGPGTIFNEQAATLRLAGASVRLDAVGNAPGFALENRGLVIAEGSTTSATIALDFECLDAGRVATIGRALNLSPPSQALYSGEGTVGTVQDAQNGNGVLRLTGLHRFAGGTQVFEILNGLVTLDLSTSQFVAESGDVIFDAGQSTPDGFLQGLALTGGTMSATGGIFDLRGPMHWSGGRIEQVGGGPFATALVHRQRGFGFTEVDTLAITSSVVLAGGLETHATVSVDTSSCQLSTNGRIRIMPTGRVDVQPLRQIRALDNIPGGQVVIEPGGVLRRPLLDNDSGQSATVSVHVDNRGTVDAFGGPLTLSGPVVQIAPRGDGLGDELIGGTWRAAFGGSVRFPGRNITRVGPGTSVEGLNAGTATEFGGLNSIRGNVRVEGPGVFAPNAVMHVEFPGALHLQGGDVSMPGGVEVFGDPIEDALGDITSAFVPALPAPRAAVARLITPSLVLGGRLRPGEASVGAFVLVGNLIVLPGGVIEIDLQPGLTPQDASADIVSVEGSVTLDGRVRVLGLAPAGTVVPIVAATGPMGGHLPAVDAPDLPAHLAASLRIVGTTLELHIVPACRADLNGDGDLNFFDVLQFVGWLAAADLRADWNNDGILDFFDVIGFVGDFDAGCP